MSAHKKASIKRLLQPGGKGCRILGVALREGNAVSSSLREQRCMDYNYDSYRTQSPCIRVIRSAQNLSVCLRASLFCLCLNAVASYPMQQLTRRALQGVGLTYSGMMLRLAKCDIEPVTRCAAACLKGNRVEAYTCNG